MLLEFIGFIIIAGLILAAPGYAQKKREQEMYERMKALRESSAALPMTDPDALAIASAAIDTATRQTRDDADVINLLNRGRLD